MKWPWVTTADSNRSETMRATASSDAALTACGPAPCPATAVFS
jgi:hypothetical protein